MPEKDYGGVEFTILQRTNTPQDFNVETETGDLVDDAVYNRNRTIEERFNVKLVNYAIDGGWLEPAINFNNMLRSSVMANDGAFDLVAGCAATITGVVSDGIFLNLNEVDYLNFSKPWWSEEVMEQLTVNGRAYMAAGDIALSLWDHMFCFVFNKRLAEDYKMGDLYQTVKDGNWTLDTLSTLTKDIYIDLDGDGAYSAGDMYGFMTNRESQIDAFQAAFGVHVVEKDSSDRLKFTIVSEHTVKALDKLNTYLNSSGNAYMSPTNGFETDIPFKESRAVFVPTLLGWTEVLRDMDEDFGILPYPKLDSEQAEYRSTSSDMFSMILIPIDVKDKDMSAIVTEALCAESYKKVVPKFYDIALKTKNARDDASSEMIDIIRDNLTFDWGYLHSALVLEYAGHTFVELVRANSSGVESRFAANASKYEDLLAKALTVYID